MEKEIESKDIKNFIRRRKKCLFITFFLFFALGLSIAIILPPIYQSKTTILIEEQQIPEEYVQSANPGYVEERIEMINQQVLARGKLLEIIDQYDLYADLRNQLTMTEIVNKMRGDIYLENIQAPLINRRTSRSIIST
ncbi:MAG: Wzz/FepE/Etk N-terminal domain-containing protein, partial [Candidatus Kariarchaeaceae archaeon]